MRNILKMMKSTLMPDMKRWFNRAQKPMPLSVMMISDDPACQMLVCTALANKGYTVMAPDSLLEALMVLDELGLPDLFIGDFVKPEVDARIFVEKLRIRFGRRALPPIMFLQDSPEDEIAALELDVYDVLPKSAEPETTVDYLYKVLDEMGNQIRH
jgi:CheY-like chemotaxis protein